MAAPTDIDWLSSSDDELFTPVARDAPPAAVAAWEREKQVEIAHLDRRYFEAAHEPRAAAAEARDRFFATSGG
jgi:hypothetical protein